MSSSIRRKVLGDSLLAHLQTLEDDAMSDVTVYRGEIPADVPLITVDGDVDSARRVAPYVVIYTSPGSPGINGGTDADLGDANDDLDWSFQLTCAAGYPADLEHLVDRVHSLTHRWTPEIDGLVCGRARPPLGYDPGPTRRDDTTKPPRFWVPLQYRLPVTA